MLDEADFVYLKGLTRATSGNLSVQLTNLQEAGYIKVSSTGRGPAGVSADADVVFRKGREVDLGHTKFRGHAIY